MDISIVYVYYNTPREIEESIGSIKSAAENIKYEIIIVDNKSPKPLPLSLRRNRKIKFINNDENLGYGKAVNQAAKIATGKYILVLNPDTICLSGSIKLMVERIKKDKEIGVLGPQQIDKNGRILHNIGSMPRLPDALFALSFINKVWPNNPYSRKYWARDTDRNREQETETIGGAAMMFRKEVFDSVGGFDERFFMYFEEADICLRIKKLGYKLLYYPKAKIIHLVGKSSSDKKWIKRTFEASRYKFFQKHYGAPAALASEVFLRINSRL